MKLAIANLDHPCSLMVLVSDFIHVTRNTSLIGVTLSTVLLCANSKLKRISPLPGLSIKAFS